VALSDWNKRLGSHFESRHDIVLFYARPNNEFCSCCIPWTTKEEYVKVRKRKVLADEDGKERGVHNAEAFRVMILAEARDDASQHKSLGRRGRSRIARHTVDREPHPFAATSSIRSRRRRRGTQARLWKSKVILSNELGDQEAIG